MTGVTGQKEEKKEKEEKKLLHTGRRMDQSKVEQEVLAEKIKKVLNVRKLGRANCKVV